MSLPTARLTTCTCEAWPKGQPLQRGLEESLAEAIDKLPIPKVMSYQRPDGCDGQVRAARRTACSRCTARMSCRSRRSASTAGRVTDGHRFLVPCDPLIDRQCGCLRADAGGRRQGGRRHSPTAARRSSPDWSTRPSTRSIIMPDALLDEVTALVEWPAVYAGTFDPRVPRRAAGMPDPDDAAEPEVLRAGRRRGQAQASLPAGQQHRDERPRGDHPRQRARAARAAGRRQVLLRPGPQDAAGVRASTSCAASSITTSWARRPSAPSALRLVASRIAPMLGADADARRPRGAAGEGGSGHRHGRRVSGAAGHDGPLLRAPRRRSGRRRRRDRRALPAALRRRRAARRRRRAVGRAGRQARDAGGNVRDRPDADRRPRPVRRCAGPRWASFAC